MGSLLDDKARMTMLYAGHLFGRAGSCRTRLTSAYASGEHAKVQWNGSAWTVRDLGSRNGTFLDGLRIEPTISAVLGCGSLLGFGSPSAPWTMVDDSPPVAMAVPHDGGPALVATENVIVFPVSEVGIKLCRAADHWVLERDGVGERVADGSHVEAQGRSYELVLPQITSETVPLQGEGASHAHHVRLLIKKSPEEEHVELELSMGTTRHDFRPREHNYLLLYLARRRLADRAASVSEESAGWVYPEEVCRDLRMDRGRLNVDVYRIRKQFSMLEEISIIERREGTRQLRIGLAAISLKAI